MWIAVGNMKVKYMKAPVKSDDFWFCDLLGGRCQGNQEWIRQHF